MVESIDFNTSSTQASSTLTSVFDIGYIPSSWNVEFEGKFRERAYFKFSSSDGAAESSTFWEMIIERYSEAHQEKYSLHNTLSDNIEVFSTGAEPIQVEITGWLLTSRAEDHRAAFLSKYVEELRSRMGNTGQDLVFVCKHTQMRLRIKNVTLINATDPQGYTQISLSGVAYKYSVQGEEAADSESGGTSKASTSQSEEGISVKPGTSVGQSGETYGDWMV